MSSQGSTAGKRRLEAFTLVEMSIVIVIIGMIVGGIMVGQEMVHTNEISRVLTDKNRLFGNMNTFRIKYNAWPGDMTNATDYWGTASGGCPSGTRTGTETCNGNGSNYIGDVWGGTQMHESYMAMQHMANAGLISGTYTGRGNGLSYPAAPGINSPVSTMLGGTFMIYGQSNPHTLYFDTVPRNAIFFGSTSGGTNVPAMPILKIKDAQALDLKADDGKPGTGNLIVPSPSAPYAPNCATSTDASTAAYNLTYSTGPQCSFLFLN